jgi:hypothetical protein
MQSVFENAQELIVSEDEKLNLVFSHKALALAEKLTKENLLSCFITGNVSVSSLAALLLAALNKYHPEITLDRCYEILDKVGAGVVFDAVVEAYKRSQPVPDPNVAAKTTTD